MKALWSGIFFLIYLTPWVALALLFILFSNTSPYDTGPAGLLSIYILLYLFFLSAIFSCIRLYVAIATRIGHMKETREGGTRLRRTYYVASILAFAPVLMMGLQSLDQLGWLDVGLVMILCAIATLYVVKRVP